MKREDVRVVPFNVLRLLGATFLLLATCAQLRSMGRPDMSVKQLEEQLLSKDSAAPETARRLGAEAMPVLERLLEHTQVDVRLGVLRCLGSLQAPNRHTLFLRALDDDDVNVRDEALQSLGSSGGREIVPGLLRYLADPDDEFLRGEVALLIGRHGDQTAINALRRRQTPESNSEVRHKLLLALARLGDPAALTALRAMLASPEADVRYDAIEGYEYVGNTQLLGDLAPLLDDHTEIFNVMPAHTQPKYIRICDVVVNTVARMISPPLSFDGSARRQFQDQELQELRAVLSRHP